MKALFLNTTIRQTLFKNAFWLTISQIVARLVRAFIVIYAARMLGATAWGEFSYVLSLAGICTLFADSGLYSLVLREWSRDAERGQKIFQTAFALKLVLLLLSLSIFFGAFFFAPPMKDKSALFLIIAAITLLDSLRDFLSALPRAQERFEIEALIQIVSGILLIAFAGGLFFSLGHTTIALGIAYVGSSVTSLIIYLRMLHSAFHTHRRREHITISSLIGVFKRAFPLGILGLFGMITLNTDILLIGTLQSLTAVGLYAAIQRIIQLLMIIPGLFTVPLTPLLSRFSVTDRDRSRTTLSFGIYLVLVIATPIAGISILFGEPITRILYGQEYAIAGTSFQILGFSLLFAFPWMMLSTFATASDDTKTIIRASLIGIIMNALLDLLLIPFFSITGAALSTCITTLLMAGYAGIVLRHLFTSEHARMFLRPLVIGALVFLCSVPFLAMNVHSLTVLIGTLTAYALLLVITNDPLLRILKR